MSDETDERGDDDGLADLPTSEPPADHTDGDDRKHGES